MRSSENIISVLQCKQTACLGVKTWSTAAILPAEAREKSGKWFYSGCVASI